MHVQNTFSRQVIHTEGALDFPKVLVFFFFTLISWREMSLTLLKLHPWFHSCLTSSSVEFKTPQKRKFPNQLLRSWMSLLPVQTFLFESSYSWRTV